MANAGVLRVADVAASRFEGLVQFARAFDGDTGVVCSMEDLYGRFADFCRDFRSPEHTDHVHGSANGRALRWSFVVSVNSGMRKRRPDAL